jgi:hypothetical protein
MKTPIEPTLKQRDIIYNLVSELYYSDREELQKLSNKISDIIEQHEGTVEKIHKAEFISSSDMFRFEISNSIKYHKGAMQSLYFVTINNSYVYSYFDCATIIYEEIVSFALTRKRRNIISKILES